MTPTSTVLLLVALLWTLPATTAVLVYRKYGSSLDNVKASLSRTAEGLMEPQTQPDA
jgi:hypothetical protein